MQEKKILHKGTFLYESKEKISKKNAEKKTNYKKLKIKKRLVTDQR